MTNTSDNPQHDQPTDDRSDTPRSLVEAVAAHDPAWMPQSDPASGIAIPAAFDGYEQEYAAIRRFVGVHPATHAGCVQLTGTDRLDLLSSLVTADLRPLATDAGIGCAPALMLNEKGRIIADMVIGDDGERTLCAMDRVDVPMIIEHIEKRIFTEDVQLADASSNNAIWLLGPAAVAAVTKAAQLGDATVCDNGAVGVVRPKESPEWIWMRCDLGPIQRIIVVPAVGSVGAVWAALLDACGYEADVKIDAEHAQRRRQSLRGRPVGWLALNTVRIEMGLPMYHIDFDATALPAELGQRAFERRVSLTKGCYLGQEIVARMHNLGQPKRVCCQVAFDQPIEPGLGQAVYASADDARDQRDALGVITSASPSPLAGDQTIALATVQFNIHTPGTQLFINSPQGPALATVTEPS